MDKISSPSFPHPARTFAPGFRISALDALVLILGSVGSWWAADHIWWAGLIVGTVVGHFFLFCNVFRISRKPELVWALSFVALTGGTLIVGFPGWIGTIAASLLLASVLIIREMKSPSYHGIGWQSINPGLPDWWKANTSPTSNV